MWPKCAAQRTIRARACDAEALALSSLYLPLSSPIFFSRGNLDKIYW